MIHKIHLYPFLLTLYELYSCTGCYYKRWCGSDSRTRSRTLNKYKTNQNETIDIKKVMF